MSLLKPINLALQGGGAHGALTWGVLDALLEDGRIEFDSITATSAGAMNAIAVAQGLSDEDASNRHQNARDTLEQFWRHVSKAGDLFAPVKRNPMEMGAAMNPFMPNWSMDNSLAFSMFETMTRMVSPYQFNPFDFNPLKNVLERIIDFEAVHRCDCLKLFISCTDVRTGTCKVFENKDITQDVILASAALPFLFKAVEVEGNHYWDGGYMGNPALWPLFYNSEARDILIVHVNPIVRDDVPDDSYAIQNRINEISFNVSLLKELRSISFVKKLINQDMLKDEYKDTYKNVLVHAIRADDVMAELSVASKFDTDWGFLKHLRDTGREKAQSWLSAHYEDIGVRDSVDIEKDYLSL